MEEIVICFFFRKKHPNAKIPKHIQDYFNEDFLKSNSIPPSSVMLVVGLHPDEATEPLVMVKNIFLKLRFSQFS